MRLKIGRKYHLKNATEGSFFVDGVFECHVLEDPVRDSKIPGETAIPYGTYRVKTTWSPRFKCRMPEILDVPGYSGVRIHWGNKPEDTHGCPLVGDENLNPRDGWIGQSKQAYRRLAAKIALAEKRGEEVWLDIVEATP